MLLRRLIFCLFRTGWNDISRGLFFFTRYNFFLFLFFSLTSLLFEFFATLNLWCHFWALFFLLFCRNLAILPIANISLTMLFLNRNFIFITFKLYLFLWFFLNCLRALILRLRLLQINWFILIIIQILKTRLVSWVIPVIKFIFFHLFWFLLLISRTFFLFIIVLLFEILMLLTLLISLI